MPMPLPADAVQLGDNAYLFPSPARGVTDCFIVGHGAAPEDKPRFFTVPRGSTVNFLTNLRAANKMDHGPIQGFKVMAGLRAGRPPEIAFDNRHDGNSAQRARCRDYVLAKAVGSHFAADPGKDDYMAISRVLVELSQAHMPLQWLPHYVSIRNRSSWFCSTNVWLSRVIAEVQKHDARIVNFYAAHCRLGKAGPKGEKIAATAGAQGLP